jgi:hypothetical protein
MVPSELADHVTSEGMELAPDPMALSPALPGEQTTLHPTVVGFLTTQIPTPSDVTCLDLSQLGEEHTNVRRHLWVDSDAVERRLVGVESHEGGGDVGFGDLFLVDQRHPTPREVELGDPVSGVGEDPTVVVGERNGEGGPFTASEGEAKLP